MNVEEVVTFIDQWSRIMCENYKLPIEKISADWPKLDRASRRKLFDILCSEFMLDEFMRYTQKIVVARSQKQHRRTTHHVANNRGLIAFGDYYKYIKDIYPFEELTGDELDEYRKMSYNIEYLICFAF
jgi:hypothetical protein